MAFWSPLASGYAYGSYHSLSETLFPFSALVINILGSFFNCCNAMCSFFVKTDLLRFLLRMVETTLPRPRSVSLGEMPRNLSSTEARISFTGTSLGAMAKFWADTDAIFH